MNMPVYNGSLFWKPFTLQHDESSSMRSKDLDRYCTIFLLALVKNAESCTSLPHMSNFGSVNSAANKDMMSKIWINGEYNYQIM